MEIAIIIALILLNGVFAMSEIALISARKSSLSNDIRHGSSTARIALKLANDPDKFLSTIQIGITLIGILTGIYSGDVLATGTPRAFHIQDGDVAECRIVGPDGFAMEPLVNPVVDLKKHPEKA